MKTIKTPEEILEFFENESSDRLMDRIEYNERVIIPAIKAYVDQLEISDEEIMKWANGEESIEDYMPRTLKLHIEKKIECRIEGAKWYREQLKNMEK